MSVVLKPSRDLDFPEPIPPSQGAICILSISNPNKFPINYKVKTTAPKRYNVKPNMRTIEAGESLDVTIRYQLPRTEQEKKQHMRNKDRFLIESKMVSSNKKRSSIFQRMWSHARTEDPREPEVHEQRLSVRTLPSIHKINKINKSEQSSAF